jgi:hypothetical protein
VSATVETSAPSTIGVLPQDGELPLEQASVPLERLPVAVERPAGRQRTGHGQRVGTREARLSEQSPATLISHIARLEAAVGATLSLLRRCIVEQEAPTREALAAEAGFTMGMSREAALANLDELAQVVGVSSLR